MRLMNEQELHQSVVVANCAMNRERRLQGANSYQRDLGWDILAFLRQASLRQPIRWVDLCCGSGRALLETAAQFHAAHQAERIQLEGVDLAGMFSPNPFPDWVILQEQSVETWTPQGIYHLVTCVHGLHYIGDKLAVIEKGVSHLSPGGVLIAHLDLDNIRVEGKPASRLIAQRIRSNGLTYNSRRKWVFAQGSHPVDFGLKYVGADDSAGPNFTGQPAVNSYYLKP